MIITISGPAGSGKGSIKKLLAQKLGYKTYDGAGDYRRIRAKALGMTIEEFNALGEQQDFTDREADEWQKNLGLTEDDFVIDGRLGFYFIPHSIKIFCDVDDDVAAERIYHDQRLDRIAQQKTHSVEEQKTLTVTRDESDLKRYKKVYGIDNYMDPKNFDLIIDTSHIMVEQAVDKILEYIKMRHPELNHK
ncbi:MAG: cytidylate kinase family protein [Candidatus Woesearchaeota archaeon]